MKTVKGLENTGGSRPDGLGHGDDGLDSTPKAWSVREGVSWASLNFPAGALRGQGRGTRSQTAEEERAVAGDAAEKGPLHGIYEELLHVSNKANSLIRKTGRSHGRTCHTQIRSADEASCWRALRQDCRGRAAPECHGHVARRPERAPVALRSPRASLRSSRSRQPERVHAGARRARAARWPRGT